MLDRSNVQSLLSALTVRLCLLLYGEWQDRTMVVKYTDVDYNVFSDAAHFVTQGFSPYKRATYRYTPLLAWLLTLNTYISPLFGKLVFILCDVGAGYLIYLILSHRGATRGLSWTCAYLWLFNPLVMTVSSRGNAESIMAVLVLGTIHCLGQQKTVAAAVVYAVAVHVKIYPATYALPIYLLLDTDYSGDGRQSKEKDSSRLSSFIRWLWPNQQRVIFIAVSASVFIFLTGLCYHCYGMEFVQETYLYHVTRRDIRHNFSVYFYMLYLTGESSYSLLLGLAAFIPQLLLLVVTSARYYTDLPFCCFIHTYLFVTFNKVCTSQYFLWYLCLLPLLVPTVKLKISQVVFMATAWFTAQALWLIPAYQLEFEGQNTFWYIWLAGLFFFVINVWILYTIMRSHLHTPLFSNGKIIKFKQKDY